MDCHEGSNLGCYYQGERDLRRKQHYNEAYRMLKSYSLEILGKKASPHWFRHTFVNHLFDQSYHLQNGEVESAFNGEYRSVS